MNKIGWNFQKASLRSVKLPKFWMMFTNPYLKLGCLLILFCLFVKMRSLGPCIPDSNSSYHRKAFYDKECADFVSWHLNLQCTRYWISKFLFRLWQQHKIDYHMWRFDSAVECQNWVSTSNSEGSTSLQTTHKLTQVTFFFSKMT